MKKWVKLSDVSNPLGVKSQFGMSLEQFILALKEGNLEAVRSYIETMKITNDFEIGPAKSSCLAYACYSNIQSIEVVQYLMQRGFNVNHINKNGVSVLMFCLLERSKNTSELVSLLFDSKSDFNYKDHLNRTGFQAACQVQPSEIVSQLIKYGVNVNVKTKHGFSALYFALHHNKDPKVIDVLLRAGAKHSQRLLLKTKKRALPANHIKLSNWIVRSNLLILLSSNVHKCEKVVTFWANFLSFISSGELLNVCKCPLRKLPVELIRFLGCFLHAS